MICKKISRFIVNNIFQDFLLEFNKFNSTFCHVYREWPVKNKVDLIKKYLAEVFHSDYQKIKMTGTKIIKKKILKPTLPGNQIAVWARIIVLPLGNER